jgi:hypothetical protein
MKEDTVKLMQNFTKILTPADAALAKDTVLLRTSYVSESERSVRSVLSKTYKQ